MSFGISFMHTENQPKYIVLLKSLGHLWTCTSPRHVSTHTIILIHGYNDTHTHTTTIQKTIHVRKQTDSFVWLALWFIPIHIHTKSSIYAYIFATFSKQHKGSEHNTESNGMRVRLYSQQEILGFGSIFTYFVMKPLDKKYKVGGLIHPETYITPLWFIYKTWKQSQQYSKQAETSAHERGLSYK